MVQAFSAKEMIILPYHIELMAINEHLQQTIKAIIKQAI